jgi:hypothetical protein
VKAARPENHKAALDKESNRKEQKKMVRRMMGKGRRTVGGTAAAKLTDV